MTIQTPKVISTGFHLLLSLMAFSAWGADAPTDFPDYPGYEKMIYKNAPNSQGATCELPAYVKKPDGWTSSDKRGAYVHIHGGGFQNGDAADHLPLISYYASRGLVGISVNYRLLGRQLENKQTNIKECVDDARSAVRWVRSHAGELGIDRNRIAVGGESAGAHLAACAATIPESTFDEDPQEDRKVSCRPNVLLLYYPACMTLPKRATKVDLAPLHFVDAETPPTLFMAGEIDQMFPVNDGFRWRDLMAKEGRQPCEFIIMRGTNHGGILNFKNNKASNDMVRQGDMFLVRNGFMSGPPTLQDICGNDFHVDPATFKPNKEQEALNARTIKNEAN